MAAGQVYRELGEAAWSWVLRQVREDDGPWLPEVVPETGPPSAPGEDRDSVYAGIGGLAPVLAEISLSRAVTGAEQALAARIAARLTATAPIRADPSLYTGLAGDVTALKLLLPGGEQVALARLATLMTPAGWDTPPELGTGSAAPVNDLVLGTAGGCWARSGPVVSMPATSRRPVARPSCGPLTTPLVGWTGPCIRAGRPGCRTTLTAPPG